MSETKAVERLASLKQEFKHAVGVYERAAEDCSACQTPGACCLDAHFVNVRISHIEAVAIDRALEKLPVEIQKRVEKRRAVAIERFGLTADPDDAFRTFACPLFEPGIGCLVHDTAKPLPCIHHACYKEAADMPPHELLAEAELAVDALDRRTYLKPRPLLPLPVAIGRI